MQKRFSISYVVSHFLALAALSLAGCSNLDSGDEPSTAQTQSEAPPEAANQQSQTLEITEHPASVSVTAGDQAEFAVVANGENLRYQWQKGASVITGATSSKFVIPQTTISDQGTYSVRVYDENNRSVMSLFAQLHVNEAPSPITISQHPESTNVTEGDSVNLSVIASGGGFLTYQWQHNGNNIDLANGNTLTLTNITQEQAGTYQVIIGNSTSSIISSPAELSILVNEQPLFITQHPSSIATRGGESAMFEVVAQGGTDLEYQWYKDNNAIAGATNRSLEILAVSADDIGLYSVIVSSPAQNIRSLDALLNVTEFGTAELQWSIPSLREDNSDLAISEISGYTLEYGKSSSTLNSQVVISDATQTNASIENLEVGAWYFRIATQDTDGLTGEFSEAVIVNVDAEQ